MVAVVAEAARVHLRVRTDQAPMVVAAAAAAVAQINLEHQLLVVLAVTVV